MRGQANAIRIGPYAGCAATDLAGRSGLLFPADMRLLPGYPSGIKSPCRDTVFFRTTLSSGDRQLAVHVKSFGLQGRLKDALDSYSGSRACRSWQTAQAMLERGIGTPRPIAFLDRWAGRRILESYLFTELEQDMCTFKDELIRLYTTDPECARIMALLECVARAIKAMHDAGIAHRDLGNQNILLRPVGPAGWSDVKFVDLNRAQVGPRLGLAARAFDISRISLPSDFLRVFKEMYFGEVVPAEFQETEASYRQRFAWHTRTRALRHPFRSRTIGAKAGGRHTDYPADRDIWVWDERSAQAISPFTSRDRRRRLSVTSHLRVAAATLGGAIPVIKSYRDVMARCFNEQVALSGRIAVAISPRRESLERELDLLRPLGKLPVMIRFMRHRGPEEWDFCAAVLRRLVAEGHAVSAALVQDRSSVVDPGMWTRFVGHVLGSVADCVDMVEVGHAINRSKWGIWTIDEHRALMDATARAAAGFSGVRFIGPAGIDFEFPFAMAALKNIPAGFKLEAVSHHLYVDRRGAPENRQGPFSTLEKCVLGRAIAENTPGCPGKFIVSEVNWPVLGTGVYSPVGSPYVSPGPRYGDPSVDEDTYADYMIRYLLLACCSGTVERVYWWRLVAQGFGLVDDSVPGDWRARPAYKALKVLLDLLGRGTFVRRVPSPANVGLYIFNLPDGSKVGLAYCLSGTTRMGLPFAFSRAMNSLGEEVGVQSGDVLLSGSPLYLTGVQGQDGPVAAAVPGPKKVQ